MYNKVTLVGRVGAEPEVRYTQSQTKITTFRLATSRTWTDVSGNRQERTEWHKYVMIWVLGMMIW